MRSVSYLQCTLIFFSFSNCFFLEGWYEISSDLSSFRLRVCLLPSIFRCWKLFSPWYSVRILSPQFPYSFAWWSVFGSHPPVPLLFSWFSIFGSSLQTICNSRQMFCLFVPITFPTLSHKRTEFNNTINAPNKRLKRKKIKKESWNEGCF